MAVQFDARNALAWYGKALCEDKLSFRQDAYFSYCKVTSLVLGLDSEFIIDDGRAALETRRVEPVQIREYEMHALTRIRELNADANPLESVVQNLSKLEKDGNPSISQKENIASQNSQTDQETIEHPRNETYQPGDIIGQNMKFKKFWVVADLEMSIWFANVKMGMCTL